MTTVGLLLIWIVVVAGVDAVVVRPWKSQAARAPLPVALCIAAAAWALGTGAASYSRLIADGSWTAATITLPFVPIKAVIFSLLAYAAGRTFMTGLSTQEPFVRRWGLAAGLAGLSIYILASDIIAMRASALERHARDPALSAQEVAALTARIQSGDAGRDEVGAFLGNPLCPADLLARYAASPDSYWRRAVARNDKIDDALAEKLAQDPDEDVRYYLAFNRQLPPALLARLAADSSEMVRNMVALTEALPDEAFDKLVDDPSLQVRATVARQPRLSKESRAKLRQDPEQSVRDAADRWGGE